MSHVLSVLVLHRADVSLAATILCSIYVTQVPLSATYTPCVIHCVIRPHPIQGTLPAVVAAAVTGCISPIAVTQVGISPTLNQE